MIENWSIILLAALVPLAMGFIWYNPKAFGKVWMSASGMTVEKAKMANRPLIILACFIFSCMLAMSLLPITIHQTHVYSIFLANEGFGVDGSELMSRIANFLGEDINNFRTFKHGALHGAITALFLALPLLSINALHEQKGFKYIAVHTGYWLVSLAVMGGIICQWA
tara:strand:- start:54 stop:554 length:501 start_codon:yes stop_codon:yes gene_type:complete